MMPDRVGTQLGNYRLLRLLGRGGTAEVYLGEHIYLKRYAALKVLRTKLFDEEAEQFLREAQMLSGLNHPHIVRVLDFAVQDTQPFLVTEYAPHGTLRTRHLRNVAIPASDVAVYIQQVASALHYAHERRVVHRDIKPENMLVGEHQEVLLADFGIAILASSTHQWYAQEKDNALAGTTLYMAPEQLQGQAQSASDQYALAVVAYEWLCGRRPFEGTLQEIAVQHLSMPPASLRHWRPDLPAALDDVVLKALAKDPRQRFPSVRDFADALLSAASCAGLSMTSIAVADNEVPVAHAIVTGGAAATMTEQTDEPQRLPVQTEPVTDEQQTLPLIEPGTRPLWKVPDVLTSLIGRERETRDIRALLAQPDVRLVTLLGPGGIGKTRLSIALAAQLRDSFAGGVCFVALATASDTKQMMTAIAHELELQEQERSYQEAVQEFLREKEFLLLLDNFEQLVQAAPVLETLLAACPRVKLLVSSRVVLRVPSERQFRLSSLAVPDMTTLPESATIAGYPAVALFVQRARTLVPSFQVTSANAPLLAEICTRLDGIPLAIELAAARIKLLPPQALLPRLTHSLQVLTRGSATLPERQQTLRRTIQWSYDLLDSWEQRVFRLLSVFRGGFTLQAVEELYTAFYRGEGTAGSVIDMVEALIDSSLVLPPGQEDEMEEPRLALLETVREYSQERLDEYGEREAAKRAHAKLFLQLAEEAQLVGEQQARWLERLEREHDNLRAAMAWMLETPDEGGEDIASGREMALRLGSALSLFWSARGYLREGRELMNRALSESAEVSLAVKAQAFMIASDLNMRLGDLDRGETLLEQSLQCFRTLGDEGKAANCLRSLGWIAHQKNEAERANALYEEALALYNALDNRQGIANTLLNMAFLMQTQGDYERALVLLEDVLARQRVLDNRVAVFSVLYQLGQVRFGLYGAREAPHIRALLEEGLELAREAGNRRGIASLQGMLGWLAYSEGKLAEARQLVEDCLLFFKDGGDLVLAGHYVALLGQIVTAQGDYARAQALFKEGLAIAREVGDNKNEIVPDCLEGMAELALLQGYHPWAVRLWGAAARWRDMINTMGMPSQRAVQERQMEIAREFLGAQSFETLLKEGRTLSPEEAFVARWSLSQRQPQTAQATAGQVSSSTKKKKIPAYPAGLSAREVDILRLVADGLSDIQVAEQLVISPRTVTTHLTSIYNKLGVNSRAAATRFAVEHHLV